LAGSAAILSFLPKQTPMTQEADLPPIVIPGKNDYAELLQVWEASVRATHHFLHEEDIQVFKPLILNEYFDLVHLRCIRINEKIVGFLGTSDDKIEMLFVHPLHQGQKIGKQLLLYAVKELEKTLVDVNEQNERALSFYRHFGFTATGRSEKDGLGKPYPILHMQLK
jgi:putative acetyltransferase